MKEREVIIMTMLYLDNKEQLKTDDSMITSVACIN